MLTENERLRFIRHGYIAKREVFDGSMTQRCLEIAWDELKKKSITSEPSTWRTNPYLRARKGVVKLRDEVSAYPELLALTENETISSVIHDLIGDNYVSQGVRGVYPTFPIPRITARPYSAHVEVHDVQIFAMVYLDDVDPGGAGLYVWPGSHIEVYDQFESRLAHRPRPGFHVEYSRINLQAPVELTGKRGDVVFCHHRLLHCGSNNFRNRVRFGVLLDFIHPDHAALCDEPPGDAMWDYWSDAIRITSETAGQVAVPGPSYSATRFALLKLQHAARRIAGKPQDEYAG